MQRAVIQIPMRILVHFSPVWSPKITPQKKYSFCFSGSPNTDFLINLPSNTYKNAWLWLRRLSDVITSNYANHNLLTVLSHLFYPPMDTYSNVHDKRASEHIPLSFAGHCICKGFVDQTVYSLCRGGEEWGEGSGRAFPFLWKRSGHTGLNNLPGMPVAEMGLGHRALEAFSVRSHIGWASHRGNTKQTKIKPNLSTATYWNRGKRNERARSRCWLLALLMSLAVGGKTIKLCFLCCVPEELQLAKCNLVSEDTLSQMPALHREAVQLAPTTGSKGKRAAFSCGWDISDGQGSFQWSSMLARPSCSPVKVLPLNIWAHQQREWDDTRCGWLQCVLNRCWWGSKAFAREEAGSPVLVLWPWCFGNPLR